MICDLLMFRIHVTRRLQKHFPDSRVTYMEPGDSVSLTTDNGAAAELQAVRGSVVGPPW
jgi:hypothetical protein